MSEVEAALFWLGCASLGGFIGVVIGVVALLHALDQKDPAYNMKDGADAE